MRQDQAAVAGEAAPAREAAREAASPLGRTADRARAWVVANRVDIAVVASITLVAAGLRLWHLGTVPLGLHGDEAWTGIDARRILDEGSIGPYVGSALGQPTGPLYFTALLFKFLPETAFTIRLSMALFGIAAIPAAYLAFAVMFNRTVAAIAAALLAGMMWHLHLSRTGFMVVSWPLAEMLVLWLVFLAMRHRNIWLFLAAGAVHGLGVYTYNAYLLFVPVPFVALLWTGFRQRSREQLAGFAVMAATFAAAALLFAMPLVRYIDGHTEEWRGHQETVNLTSSQQWKDADGFSAKADLVWERYKEWQRGLVYGDRPDLGDGLATDGHPVVDPIVFILAVAGAGIALWNIRKAEYAVLLAALALLPLGALLTIHDGLFRRTLGLAPFLAVLAAFPLAWLWQHATLFRKQETYLIYGAVLLVPAYVGVKATYQYFGPVQDSVTIAYVYPYQLDAASRYMDDLPPDTVVYFYAGRWSINYETRRFLAPDVAGIDRSREFRPQEIAKDDPLDLTRDREGPVAFVFLAPYLDANLEQVQRDYPGGELTEERRGAEVLFRAYHLPE